MEQLLCHLVADYWLQNDWMATNKKKKWFPAIVHGFIYTLPFLLLTHSFMALLVIGVTHIIIDHTDIVCKLNQIKNWDFRQDNYAFLDSQTPLGEIMVPVKDGYFGRPFAIRVWLIIIQDNILHLLINYLAIKYF